MSKFVTYPAVTVLDNDHSLLIDSPNAGTNSISADNAADTLLSKWSGFDTFDEAVQNTISNNQEFIDRDTAIREETADLKRKIVTTFPAKDASGQIATFESEFEDAPLKSCIVQVDPVQDLHGYDHPWPAGGGKNKFDITAYDSIYISYDYKESSYYCKRIQLKPNTEYTVSFTSPAADSNCIILINYVTNVNALGFVDLRNVSGSKTYTTDNTGCLYIGSVNSNNADYNARLSVCKIQIEEGSTATYWTPYENICPISGWTGVEVQRTGKNLLQFPFDTASGTSFGGLTVTYTNDGVITVKGTKTASGTYTLKQMKLPAGTYTVKLNAELPSGMSLRVYHAASNTTYASTRTMAVTFTLTDELELFVYILTQNNLTGNVDITFRPQIELGSTATDYEPYQGETYPITFPASAGTVYGGYVDVTGGELVVDRAMVDLGTLTWMTTSNNRAYIDNFTTAYGCALPQSAYNVAGCIAEQYKEVPASGSLTLGAFAILQVKAIYFYYDGTNLPTGKMVFPLAEPIHYPLTPTEIKTLLGTNNIWADTGDTAVKYLMSDVGWYVEKKLRAFQSVLAGVEDSAVASKNYSTNSYLIFNDDIYRVTKTIASGETIEDGVNVTKTTVAEQLMALAQV